MRSVYRSEAGEEHIRRWCVEQLEKWPVPHQRAVLTAHMTPSHVVTAGTGARTVVFVPGTNFNAATSLPLASALLDAGNRVVLVDVPGQPGLSSGRPVPGSGRPGPGTGRPRFSSRQRASAGGRLAWYGAWLSEVVAQVSTEPVVVMGHSLGAAIALAADSPLISRRVLVSPGGLTRLRVRPRVLTASAAWYLRPTPQRSARLLRTMLAPGHRPRVELVEWLTLVARHARSSAAPEAVRMPTWGIPQRVVVGRHDTFLPPRHLESAIRTKLGAELEVIPDAGHLLVEETPARLAALADPTAEPHPPR